MDKITAMKVFVEVVNQQSQTAAAEKLDMSRAMVTRYLTEIESWLGTRLLHRTTRRLSLTPAGEKTLSYCQSVLHQVNALESDALSGHEEPSGLLRLSAPVSIGQTYFSGAIAAFLNHYPKVKVDLQLVDYRVNLVEERIDLALRITNDLDPSLIARKLGDCHSVVCASPAYLAKHGLPSTLSELSTHNCLTHSYVGKSEWVFFKNGQPETVEVSGNLSANEVTVLMQAAMNGNGIAMLPKSLAFPNLNKGELVQVLPDYAPFVMGIYAVYSSRQFMPTSLRCLLDFLVEYFGSRAEIL